MDGQAYNMLVQIYVGDRWIVRETCGWLAYDMLVWWIVVWETCGWLACDMLVWADKS